MMLEGIIPDAVLTLMMLELLIIPLVGVLTALLLRHHPAQAHSIIAGALIAVLLSPIATMLAHFAGLGVLPGESVALTSAVTAPDTFDGSPAGVSLMHVLIMMGATVWALWSGIGLWRICGGFMRGRHAALRCEEVINDQIAVALARACAITGRPARDVRIVRTEDTTIPAIFAWSHPVRILLPARAHALSGEALESIFVHELAHWRRRDHWWRLLAEFAIAVLPWHPLTWIMRRAVESLADRACDAWVVNAGHRADAYASVLLRFVQDRPRPSPAVAALGRRSALRCRMHALLDGAPPPAQCGRRWRCTVTVGVMAIIASFALAQSQPMRLPALSAADAARIAASPVQAVPGTIDFGRVPTGREATREVRLVNLGDRTVHLINAKPSCGCTTLAPIAPRAMAPGDEYIMRISMTPPDTNNTEKTSTITFQFEGQDPLVVSLRLMTSA